MQLEITEKIDDNSARFFDVIANVIVFKMSRQEGHRLWAKVFIENKVEVELYRQDCAAT